MKILRLVKFANLSPGDRFWSVDNNGLDDETDLSGLELSDNEELLRLRDSVNCNAVDVTTGRGHSFGDCWVVVKVPDTLCCVVTKIEEGEPTQPYVFTGPEAGTQAESCFFDLVAESGHGDTTMESLTQHLEDGYWNPAPGLMVTIQWTHANCKDKLIVKER